MIVWLVTWNPYDETYVEVDEVFSSEEKAAEYVSGQLRPSEYNITEMVVL